MDSVFARRFYEARTALGISQRELARQLGISHPTIQHWESGTHKPDTDGITLAADYFQVSADWLLGREERADFHACKEWISHETDQDRLATIISIAANNLTATKSREFREAS